MTHPTTLSIPHALRALALAAGCALGATASLAHVTLPAGGATAGSTYAAAFRVGHACQNANATTAIKVRLPAGFCCYAPLDDESHGWDFVCPGLISGLLLAIASR